MLYRIMEHWIMNPDLSGSKAKTLSHFLILFHSYIDTELHVSFIIPI